jgi:hypothetical protein
VSSDPFKSETMNITGEIAEWMVARMSRDEQIEFSLLDAFDHRSWGNRRTQADRLWELEIRRAFLPVTLVIMDRLEMFRPQQTNEPSCAQQRARTGKETAGGGRNERRRSSAGKRTQPLNR